MDGLVTHCIDSHQDQTSALKTGACNVSATHLSGCKPASCCLLAESSVESWAFWIRPPHHAGRLPHIKLDNLHVLVSSSLSFEALYLCAGWSGR